MSKLLPWHIEPWRMLIERQRQGRLPHALLLCGPAGIGKDHFARTLVRAMLCETPQPDGQPCGTCRGCLLNAAGNHPDSRIVGLPEDKKVIGVDQIRELREYLGLKSHYAGYRTVLISPAEQMNTQAANSLLKTLEEPPARSLLILAAGNAGQLPATVRSRCQRVIFSVPPLDMAQRWLSERIEPHHDPALLLSLAGGAPLAALEIARSGKMEQRLALFEDFEKLARRQCSPVALAGTWLKLEPQETLYWMQGWLSDMIRLKSTSRPPALINQDLRPGLQNMAAMLDLQMMYRQLDRVTEAARLAAGQVNAQLLMEDVLIAWQDHFPKKMQEGKIPRHG